MPGCPQPKGKGRRIKESLLGRAANLPMKRRSPKPSEQMMMQETDLMPQRDIMTLPDTLSSSSNTMY